MNHCDECKISFDNTAYKYCPFCGKVLTIQITIPSPNTTPINPFTPDPVYPYLGDPYLPQPTIAPINPFRPNTIHRIPLLGENGFITYCTYAVNYEDMV